MGTQEQAEVRYQYEVSYWTLEQAEAMPYGLPTAGEEVEDEHDAPTTR